MRTQTLTINFAAPSTADASENYWIRLEQTSSNGDFATVADAARLVDAVFDIHPCVEVNVGGQTPIFNEDGTYAAAVKEEEYINVVNGVINFDACLATTTYDWTATLAIIRSHNTSLYNLVITGGELLQTVVVQKQLTTTLIFTGESSKDLDFPILSGPSVRWAGTVVTKSGHPPRVTILGSTVNLSESATGNLNLQYLTEYDLATITVPGNGETSLQSAELLAFYHYLVETGSLTPPDLDETSAGDNLLCNSNSVWHPPDEEKRCWETVRHRVMCSCNDGEYSHEDVEQSVTCREGALPGDHFMGTRSVIVGYTDCGTPSFDDLSDPEFYRQKCCTPPPFGLPRCASQRSVMGGGAEISNGPQFYIDLYGPGTKIVGVSPRDGICGTIEWRQEVIAKNCCDDVVPMSPHPDNPTEISPGGAVILNILDGRQGVMWLWKASGGLTFENGKNEIWAGSSIKVYAPAVLCSRAVVQVEDGCTRLNMPLSYDGNEPLTILNPEDAVVAPGGLISFGATGGVPPYLWGSSGDLTLVYGPEIGIFQAGLDFCGVATVTVSDSCTETDDVNVRSTDGYWKSLPLDPCGCLASGNGETTSYIIDNAYFPKTGEVNDGRYKCEITLGVEVPWDFTCDSSSVPCTKEFIQGMNEQYCDDYRTYYDMPVSNGGLCCVYDASGSSLYLERYQYVSAAFEWVCHE